MRILRRIVGPESKYEDDIPFTYEARVEIEGIEKEYKSYVADTICALVEHLEKEIVQPRDVTVFEIYRKEEKELDIRYCTSDEGQWLNRAQLCDSFRKYYPEHIKKSGCTFEDRDRHVTGP